MAWFLDLSDDLRPVGETAKKCLEDRNDLDESIPGVVRFSNRPVLGPEWYAVVLFHGLESPVISSYEDLHSIRIPSQISRLLGQLNGASLFRLQLYGVPPSMAQAPPRLDRTRPQPLDLATANHLWRHEFPASEVGFHFAGGPWSSEENVGYFVSHDGIEAYRKGGERVAAWRRMDHFLTEEIDRCAKLYEGFEQSIAAALNTRR